MKAGKKGLVLALCAALLVVATVFSTAAFLTSQDQVTNTFTVGNVKIALDEAKVDEYGLVTPDVPRVQANAYKLIPGRTYTKDPTVHVGANSEDCWLFVKVENGLSAIEAAGNTTIAAQMTANGWTAVAGASNVYAYKDIVTASQNIPVFGSFSIATTAQTAGYEDTVVSVTAYAVQADGFATAADAWTAAPMNG